MERILPTYPSQTLNLNLQSPLERLLVEQALLMAQELRGKTFAAPNGHVLDSCEETACTLGRELIRKAIQSASQEFIDDAEKKTALSAPVHVVTNAKTKAPTKKTP